MAGRFWTEIQCQRWKTFLRNHKLGIAAMDFLVIPTVRFRLLYAWFVICHGRREIVHFGVTAHPTSSWVVQKLLEAFQNNTSPRFLIYDNDFIFSEGVTESIKNIGIEPQRTALSLRAAGSSLMIAIHQLGKRARVRPDQ